MSAFFVITLLLLVLQIAGIPNRHFKPKPNTSFKDQDKIGINYVKSKSGEEGTESK